MPEQRDACLQLAQKFLEAHSDNNAKIASIIANLEELSTAPHEGLMLGIATIAVTHDLLAPEIINNAKKILNPDLCEALQAMMENLQESELNHRIQAELALQIA